MEKKILPQDPPLWERRHKKRLWSFIGFFIIVFLLSIALFINWLLSRGSVSTEDAYVHGNIIPISSQIEGRVTDIYFDQGSFVQAGETLLNLDPTFAKLELESAKANLNETARKVAGFYLQVEEANQTINLRETQLQQAELEAERRSALNCTRAIGEEAFTASQTQLKMAQINKDLAVTAKELAQAQIEGISPYHHPLVLSAKLQLQKALLNLENTRVQAPVFGIIAQKTAQVGQMIRPGESLFTIVPVNELWVEANFMETQLKNIMIDQPATLVSDMYGSDVVYHGKVMGMRPGTGVSFSLIPPQNATGNWIKIIQRVPVLISLDEKQLQDHPLYLGLSMKATIDITNDFTPSNTPTRPLDHKTDIYSKQLKTSEVIANQMVEESFFPFLKALKKSSNIDIH